MCEAELSVEFQQTEPGQSLSRVFFTTQRSQLWVSWLLWRYNILLDTFQMKV